MQYRQNCVRLYLIKKFFHITYRKIVYMSYGQTLFFYMKYIQFVYMICGQIVYIRYRKNQFFLHPIWTEIFCLYQTETNSIYLI